MKMLSRVLTFGGIVLATGGCGQDGLSGSGDQRALASFPSEKTSNLRVSLTDAPAKDFTSVFVNVDKVELFIRRGSGEARVQIAKGLGRVDLMTLRNGVLLPMEDLNLAPGTEIMAIRLILNSTGNAGVKGDGSQCDLRTPSAQQSGIKIKLGAPVKLDEGYRYSMVVDFDAGRSVVVQGNGGCLLKPVLKLSQVQRQGQDDSGGSFDPIVDGGDTNSGGSDDSGFDPSADPSDPPVISIEDSYNLAYFFESARSFSAAGLKRMPTSFS